MDERPGGRGVTTVRAERVAGADGSNAAEDLAIEEPCEISVSVEADGRRVRRAVAVTMRTPGDDPDLAVGFLVTEGIVAEPEQIVDVEVEEQNQVCVRLRAGVEVDLEGLERHSFLSSSCGVCGKKSMAAVVIRQRHRIAVGVPLIDPAVVHGLPATLRAAQPRFARTGGLHAAALFNSAGGLLDLREDVGRHNALDKLIGARFLAGKTPLSGQVVLVSGRVSFELVQKAALAGAPILAAVGAPSSLAVELATDRGMTLLGFVREGRFNVYSHAARIAGLKP
jgi:FdhD protein